MCRAARGSQVAISVRPGFRDGDHRPVVGPLDGPGSVSSELVPSGLVVSARAARARPRCLLRPSRPGRPGHPARPSGPPRPPRRPGRPGWSLQPQDRPFGTPGRVSCGSGFRGGDLRPPRVPGRRSPYGHRAVGRSRIGVVGTGAVGACGFRPGRPGAGRAPEPPEPPGPPGPLGPSESVAAAPRSSFRNPGPRVVRLRVPRWRSPSAPGSRTVITVWSPGGWTVPDRCRRSRCRRSLWFRPVRPGHPAAASSRPPARRPGRPGPSATGRHSPKIVLSEPRAACRPAPGSEVTITVRPGFPDGDHHRRQVPAPVPAQLHGPGFGTGSSAAELPGQPAGTISCSRRRRHLLATTGGPGRPPGVRGRGA